MQRTRAFVFAHRQGPVRYFYFQPKILLSSIRAQQLTVYFFPVARLDER
jgi:hypothetical protein